MDNSETFTAMLDNAIESEPEAFKGFDRTKNVQGQLQEMICDGPWPWQIIDPLHNWYNNRYDDYPSSFQTMEQLWLAFVMKKKHQKAWNGSEWVNHIE